MDSNQILSKNLKRFHEINGGTLAEFSKEVGIPRSTLKSIMADGNTTIHTATQIAEHLGISLDMLLLDETVPEKLNITQWLVQGSECFASLPKEVRAEVAFHIDKILEALMR